MIHQYKSNGYNIVMDVNSGSVHVVDDIVYDMIPLVEPLVTEGIKDADTIKAAVLNLANIPYPQEEITEAVDEVLELEKAGQLFAPDIYENYIFDFKKRQTVVKALCLHIAHDCIIGSNIIIGNSTKLAGEVKVEDYAIISASVLCHQFCNIGCNVMIQGGSRFSQDIPPYIIAGKEPIRYAGINIIGLRRKGFTNEQIDQIHNAYRLLYGEGTREENIQKIKETLPITEEIQHIIEFVQASSRGIIK